MLASIPVSQPRQKDDSNKAETEKSENGLHPLHCSCYSGDDWAEGEKRCKRRKNPTLRVQRLRWCTEGISGLPANGKDSPSGIPEQ